MADPIAISCHFGGGFESNAGEALAKSPKIYQASRSEAGKYFADSCAMIVTHKALRAISVTRISR